MTKNTNYDDWSKEELLKEIEALKKQKTYGLIWEREKTKEKFDYYINWEGKKTEELFKGTEDKFPVLKEIKGKEITTDKNQDFDIMIQGDNYHALAVLNFTHHKGIDVIYLDPPYNTGNKDFKYNDQWVDKEDGYRHSKWLTFMEKRLKLARNLLKDTGIIIISIDDNEFAQLKLLCDQIFLEQNFIATLPTIMNLKGNQDQFGFAGTHEYTLLYAKSIQKASIGNFPVASEEEGWQIDEYGYFKQGANLKGTGVNAPREKRENLYYPIFVTKTGEIYVTDDNKIPPERKNAGDTILLPITDGKEMSWRWEKKKVNKDKYDIIVIKNEKSVTLYKKQRPTLTDLPSKKPKTIFYKPEYSSGNGTNLLKKLFGEKVFNNPKPLELMKDLLLITTDKDSTVLDFFAGTGTTAHAVMELNQEDGGNRKYILCTNNEDNNGNGLRIATDICYPRLQKVITEYSKNKKSKIDGVSSNLKYFETAFVDSSPTDKNKKAIVDKSTEMICLKENAFTPVKKGSGYQIFKNNKIYLGIIYDDDSIETFVNEAKTIEGTFNIYVFSLDDNVHEYDFKDMKSDIKLCPIPESILHIYRRIFKSI
jgi:adenine-specific DNA-methyltransferase